MNLEQELRADVHKRLKWREHLIGTPRRFAAKYYRRSCHNTRFIGITGSCGKTTTKGLVSAVLKMAGKVVTSNTETNPPSEVAKTVLRVRRSHRYCVQEVSEYPPGALVESTDMFEPHIAVVTFVQRDHRRVYRNLDTTRREILPLVESLPRDGTAILNADDERVIDMRAHTRASVITYGLCSAAMMRGEDLSFRWPEPLSLTACFDGRKVRVQTRLLGEHWVYPVLAAMATAVAEEIPMEEAARGVGTAAPAEQRLSEWRMPDGITFILDTWKAPIYTVPASLRVLETAAAERRIAIIGTMSDISISASKAYRKVARQALAAADLVIMVGRWSQRAIKGHPAEHEDRLLGFDDVYTLRNFLRGFLTSGDLVLLKGSIRNDHLERIARDWETDFACWRLSCGRLMSCAGCHLRTKPFTPDG